MAKPRYDINFYPEWVHQELQNWARWCWLGAWPHPIPPSECMSLEHLYVRVNEDGSTESVDDKPVKPNEPHARLVQVVWDSLPRLPQLALRAEYPQHFESGRVEHGRIAAARYCHMSLGQYESALQFGVFRVERAFEVTTF
jgi:hypothetical protein